MPLPVCWLAALTAVPPLEFRLTVRLNCEEALAGTVNPAGIISGATVWLALTTPLTAG